MPTLLIVVGYNDTWALKHPQTSHLPWCGVLSRLFDNCQAGSVGPVQL